jgi:hypothetical protein
LLLHTTALRGNPWDLDLPKPFLKPGAFHLQQIHTSSRNKSVDFWQGETPAQRVVPPSLALTSSRNFIPIIKLQIKPGLLPDIAPIISANWYQTVSTVKLERRLGVLTGEEMSRVRDALANRLGI